MGTRVKLAVKVQKQLLKVPRHIAKKLKIWVESVETDGINEVRKIPGYHDEPLKGERFGQRSVRLSLSYRAIYKMKKEGVVEFINVEEVSKHEY